MKQICALMLLVLMVGLVAYAEQPETILFRDIPWMEREYNVLNVLEQDMPESIRGMSIYEDEKIGGWKTLDRYLYADPVVKDGGVSIYCHDVDVAGYTAQLELSFAYAIEHDKVLREVSKARFYKADYDIIGIEDVDGAFEGLTEKLTTLYGKSQDESYHSSFIEVDSPQGLLWTAKDGSRVWLAKYYDNAKERFTEIRISYVAPDVESMLINLDAQIRRETAEAEASEREKNIDNYNGL